MTDIRHVALANLKRGIKDGHVVRLLPRHDVFLTAYGSSRAHAPRFADLFRQTWARLPLYARRRILQHWRAGAHPFIAVSPDIELTDFWSERKTGRGLRGDKACVFRRGHKLRFCTKIVCAYPDNLVCDLIAHELAHVHQWARGDDLNEVHPMEFEEDADWQVEAWGFSSDAMDEWDRANGVAKVINLDQLSPAEQKRQWAKYWARLQRDGR